jgi:hypothetical protein
MRELDIVNYVRNQRLSCFAQKLTMNGHQRWFVNKFMKYNLASDDVETMEAISRTEEKEAARTRPGHSFEAYASIAHHANNLNTHEATDRRIVFELTGRKLTPYGVFAEDEKVVGNDFFTKMLPDK